MQSHTVLCLGFALMLGASGCSRTAADLRQWAMQSRDAAQSAYESREVRTAEKAAARAEKAARQAADLLARDKHSAPAQTLMTEIHQLAREAQHYAGMAREEKRCRDRLDGWKCRTYRSVRGQAQRLLFAHLAACADEMAQTNSRAVSALIRAGADVAWQTVTLLSERPPQPTGPPDWNGAARELHTWATQPPVRTAEVLACGFALAQCTDFALCEVEACDPRTLTTPAQQTEFYFTRGVVYMLEGWGHLALREFELAATAQAVTEGPPTGNEKLFCLRLFTACLAFDQGDYVRADQEIARALQSWPNNPLTVFLTGERLRGNGEYEKAANSIEQVLAGTQDEGLAQRLAERAREIRNRKGDAPPLFADKRLLLELTVRYACQRAKDSVPMKQFSDKLLAAQAMGRQVLENLPGFRRTASSPQ